MIHHQTKVLRLVLDTVLVRIRLSWHDIGLRSRRASRNNDLLDYARIRTALLFLV
jgi:hypothetical protein